MKYASVEDIEKYLDTTIEQGSVSQVENWIEGVSRLMDSVANRTLVAPEIGSGEDYEEKYYDGNGKGFISIEDCQEVISLQEGDQFGEELTEIEDFITYPKQAPFRKIIRKTGAFNSGIQNIRVEGRFGYFNEVPKDLNIACTVIAAGIVTASKPGKQNITSEKYIDYAVSYSDDKGWADYNEAVATVERYRKIDF